MTEHLSLADRGWPLLGRLMRVHVVLYRATGGKVGQHIPGLPPLLLLDHVGAKTGKHRTTPLAYMPHDGDFIVAGAKGGHPNNPGWSTTCARSPTPEYR